MQRVPQRFLPLLPCGSALSITTFEDKSVIGGVVWPMASVLSRYLLQSDVRASLQAANAVVELGSGTGALGLFAAGLGARCTLTEHRPPNAAMQPVSYTPDGELDLVSGTSGALLEVLLKNVAANLHLCSAPHPPVVRELDWSKPCQVAAVKDSSPGGAGFDVVLGSDLTYNTGALDALAATVSQLLLPGGVALIAHQRRLYNVAGSDAQLAEFAKAVAAAGLQMEVGDFLAVEEEGVPGRGGVVGRGGEGGASPNESMPNGRLLWLSHGGDHSVLSAANRGLTTCGL